VAVELSIAGASRRAALERVLRPASVAIVGASDRNGLADLAVPSLERAAGVRSYLVNPVRPRAYGRATYPDLASIGRPVDAVLSYVGAERSAGVVAEAAECGAGGVIVTADGFNDPGRGAQLTDELLQAAGDRLLVLGPNCNGYLDARRGIRMSPAPALPIVPGSVGFVTHSGGFLSTLGAAGRVRGVGFTHLISTGNELDVGMEDCIEFLVDDPATKVICLAVETIRRAPEFFAAVSRATRAGKPVAAVKLGRGARSSEIARSHTGALTSPGWVYEAAFRQHGILVARDMAELADLVVCFDQLPPERWSPARGLVAFTTSGGYAEMFADAADDHGVELARVPRLREQLWELLPHHPVENPLDAGGRLNGDAAAAEALLRILSGHPDIDTLVLLWFLDDAGARLGKVFLESFTDLAESTDKTLMIGSIEDAAPGPWASRLPARGVAVGAGLATTLRAIRAMGTWVRERGERPAPATHVNLEEIGRPAPDEIVAADAGPILSFAATMRLLGQAGVRVAPWRLVHAGEEPSPPGFPGPYAVKLADVPHRTELGAVLLGVPAEGLGDAVGRLRRVAGDAGVPSTVVVQAQLAADGEAFVGALRCELGAMVVWGPGGVLVEAMRRVDGALAPLSRREANRLLDDLAATGVFDGVRGGRAWDRAALAATISAVGDLVARASWIASLDVNPLVVCADGFVAVDGLCVIEAAAP